MNPLFFDIETIATTNPAYRQRVEATIKPPASMKKAETIAKWEAEEKASAIDEAIQKTVFNGGLCSIVQIQYAIGDGEVVVLQSDDESLLLQQFFSAVDSERIIGQVVGHYITGFDLRILKQRAIIHGLRMPAILRRAADARPWDDVIFDTMFEWAGRDSVSMDNLCYYLSIETPKVEMSGAGFGDAWRSGSMRECYEYGFAEIIALRNVYKKMRGICDE